MFAFLSLILGISYGTAGAPQTFTVATYNLENYLLTPAGSRPAKPAASRQQLRTVIRSARPDVLAVQEIGATNALIDLQQSLQQEGLNYPYWEHVTGLDTNLNVAVLSRFPIIARQPHPDETFLLRGRRFRTSRGFLEVVIQASKEYPFTLVTAHLKSRRPSGEADESDLRLEEALLLRGLVEAKLRENPALNLIVLGDFNDVRNSKSTRAVIGKGKLALIDTRPAERNGDNQPNPTGPFDPRNITWTHYYGQQDTYSRIDYILVSRAMAAEWNRNGTYIVAVPNWGSASDHRLLIAEFTARNQ